MREPPIAPPRDPYLTTAARPSPGQAPRGAALDTPAVVWYHSKVRTSRGSPYASSQPYNSRNSKYY